MLQAVLQIVISSCVFITACLMLLCISNPKIYGAIASCDLCCLLENTPALNAFLMFVVQTILVVLVEACFFNHISNSIIISLDIIYFISMMLLVLYHSLKDSDNLLLKATQ